MRAFKIHSLSSFQIWNLVLLTIVYISLTGSMNRSLHLLTPLLISPTHCV